MIHMHCRFSLLKNYLLADVVTSPIDFIRHSFNPTKQRGSNAVLQEILKIMGTSLPLYNSILHFCRTLFVNTNNHHFCTLRYELLMALHDHRIEEVFPFLVNLLS